MPFTHPAATALRLTAERVVRRESGEDFFRPVAPFCLQFLRRGIVGMNFIRIDNRPKLFVVGTHTRAASICFVKPSGGNGVAELPAERRQACRASPEARRPARRQSYTAPKPPGSCSQWEYNRFPASSMFSSRLPFRVSPSVATLPSERNVAPTQRYSRSCTRTAAARK